MLRDDLDVASVAIHPNLSVGTFVFLIFIIFFSSDTFGSLEPTT